MFKPLTFILLRKKAETQLLYSSLMNQLNKPKVVE